VPTCAISSLLATFFLGIAFVRGPVSEQGLWLTSLVAAAPQADPTWLRTAFLLAVVGYGTKMGLAPLHTWLPDAHSEAPSPVSALLSGALLNCAFLGILRFLEVAIAGGVAANGTLREKMIAWGAAHGVIVRLPEKRYCTDNAAMIAFAAMQRPGSAGDPRRVSARSRIA